MASVADGAVDGVAVAAVAVDEHDAAAQSAERTSSTITAAVTSVPIDSVPGNPACSPLAVTADARADDDARPAGGEGAGEGLGDDRVGAERQVRTVLLARADRHAQHRARHLGPGRLGQPHGIRT